MKNIRILFCVLIFSSPGIIGAQITGVSIDSFSGEFSVRYAVNTVNDSGLSGGIHSNLTSDMWLTSLSGSDYIVFDLGANYDVTDLHVWNYFETDATLRGINSVTISYDTTVAGDEFTSAGSYDFASETDGSGSDIAISTLTNARLVRFDVNSTHGSVAYVGLSEVQFTSAVPEASTWGVIAGLVSLGVVAWRKRFSKRN